MKLSVIVPVYNEMATLPEIFRRICSAPLTNSILMSEETAAKITALEIVAVDDASTDGSRQWLEEASKNFTKRFPTRTGIPCEYRLLFQTKNAGKGAAIQKGIAASTGDIVLIQDADLEYNPKDYPKLLAPILLNEADAVFGSRFLGTETRVLFFWHALINKFLTFLINLFCNMIFTDMETCYKVMRGELARSLKLVSNRFGIEPELTARLSKARVRIYEVGISYNGRTFDEGKKIGPLDGIAALYHIFRFSVFGGSPLKAGIRREALLKRLKERPALSGVMATKKAA